MKCYKPIGSRLTVSHLPHTHTKNNPSCSFYAHNLKSFTASKFQSNIFSFTDEYCSNSLFDLFQCDIKSEMAATSCLCSLFWEPVVIEQQNGEEETLKNIRTRPRGN